MNWVSEMWHPYNYGLNVVQELVEDLTRVRGGTGDNPTYVQCFSCGPLEGWIVGDLVTGRERAFFGDIYTIDIVSDLELTNISEINPVPIPAAVWLFGTGILGLIGFSKRRKAA